MKISIHKEVFKKFPQLQLGFVYVEDLDNHRKIIESEHLVHDIVNLIKLTFHKETLKNHYLISPWKVARAEFGKEAQHYQTSVEILLQKVLSNHSVVEKNTLTNLFHYLSLRYIVPGGMDDYFKIKGKLEYALANGKEKVGILKTLKEGALYYQDEESVLGTKLDFWKNKRTLVSAGTTKALVHFAALPPIDQKKLNQILAEAKEVIKTFCNGKVKVFVLDRKKNEVTI